jgi:hypothetical protein
MHILRKEAKTEVAERRSGLERKRNRGFEKGVFGVEKPGEEERPTSGGS